MKRFLHAGEGYAPNSLTHKLLSPFTRYIKTSSPNKFGWLAYPSWVPKVTGIQFLVAFFKPSASCNFSTIRTSCIYLGLFFMCLQAAIANQPDPATDRAGQVALPLKTDSIRPLQIGDKLPEYLWDIPLQVVNYPEEKETMTLSEYKGKLILLDFLSSVCPSCIKAIPELEKAVHSFGSQAALIAITPESVDRMNSFVPNNPNTKSSTIPFVVSDQNLKAHFPHIMISHVAWIDQLGYVRGLTGTAHVRESTLQELAAGETSGWPVKTENTSFYNAPLVELSANDPHLPNNAQRSIYYSMITGYTEGVGSYIHTAQDTTQGINRYSLRNRSVLDLYLISIDRLYKLSPEQIIWEVENPSAFDLVQADLTEITLPQWYQQYALCYEATFPLDASTDQMKSRMRTDLNHFLQMNGRLEIRNGQEVFILSDLKTN